MALRKVEICGVDTSKLKVLKAEEMRELFIAMHEGDQTARQKIIEGNLRLVLSIIQRFSSRGENPDDLFQVGCVGLIKAIDNFDITMGVRFSTYAVPMVIGEIRRYLRDNNTIRVSRSLRDTAYKALGVREELTRKNGQEPRIEEIAEQMGLSREEVTYALDAIQAPISLFEPVYHDGADAIYVMDQVRDDKEREESWVEDLSIQEALQKLGEREKKIVTMRFFQGRTQMEVAKEVGISQAQVSRLEKLALNKMRKQI
ncbi:MAG: RNA polymerase sporulation sigma factor SigG [Christensenellales bacterium]